MSIVGDIATASIKPFLNANGKLDQFTAEIAAAITAAAEAELSARSLDQDIGVLVIKRDWFNATLRLYSKTPRGGQLLLDGAEPVSKAEAYRLRETNHAISTPGYIDEADEEELKRDLGDTYKPHLSDRGEIGFGPHPDDV